MFKNICLAAATLAIVSACSQDKKILVLYYSQFGSTEAVAQEIQKQLGADIESFDVVESYGSDYDATIARCLQEMGSGTVPALKAIESSIDDYDVIFLGYPIWFGTYAPPVKALLSEVDLNGKVIVPFCTFGSGGLEVSVADLKAALPDSDVRDGYGVRAARLAAVPAEVEEFLVSSGFKEGVLEVLPEYSELQPVTEEEAAIFDAACSSYQMPLGTPVACGKRETSKGTDYMFSVQSGSAVTSTIYVTVSADGNAEFTRVVR